MNYISTTAAGRLTKNAVSFEANGDKKPMSAFTVAVNVGEERTTYVDCEIRGDRSSKLKEYLVKGKEVLVTGTPYLRTYEAKDGSKGASLALFVNDIQLGSDAQSANSNSPAPAKQLEQSPI